MAISSPETSNSEQFAVRELIRSWAAGSGALAASRDVEQGRPDAWRAPYDALAQLGIFGVAVAEEHGGAGGSVEELLRDGRRGRRRDGPRSGRDNGAGHARHR